MRTAVSPMQVQVPYSQLVLEQGPAPARAPVPDCFSGL
jgi:hypothetical protein